MAERSRASRRREMDLMKLVNSHHRVHVSPSNNNEFWVELAGPQDTAYEGGVWFVHVLLTDEYPFRSPSIGFANRVLHPNVDEASGTVCLDVINQTWTPMYELQNVFETFLPQLLRYPNPADPLNPHAAALALRDPVAFAARVQEHAARFATRIAAVSAVAPYIPALAAELRQLQQPAAASSVPVGDSPASNFSRGLSDAPPSPLENEDYEPEEIEL